MAKLESIFGQLRSYAEEWDVFVAEDGEATTKKAFSGLIKSAIKNGADPSSLTKKYPDGTAIRDIPELLEGKDMPKNKRKVNEDEDLELDLGTDGEVPVQDPESPAEPEDGDEEGMIGEDTEKDSDDEDDKESDDDKDDKDDKDSDDDEDDKVDEDTEKDSEGKPWDHDGEPDEDHDGKNDAEEDEDKNESRKRRLSEAYRPGQDKRFYVFIPESSKIKPVSVVAESRKEAAVIVRAVLVKQHVLESQKAKLPEGDLVRGTGVYEAVAKRPAPRKRQRMSESVETRSPRIQESGQGHRKLSAIISRI